MLGQLQPPFPFLPFWKMPQELPANAITNSKTIIWFIFRFIFDVLKYSIRQKKRAQPDLSTDFNIQTVLVAPLDWGLGHATRCIPLIHALTHMGYQVIIATDGAQENLLKKEFPHHLYLKLPGYQIRYSRSGGWLPFKIIQQLPALVQMVRWEHRWLQTIIKEYKIDLVIADNRYGLFTQQIPSVFITHQLTIKAPNSWIETLIQKINYHYINRFTVCWVPDMQDDNGLAGILSHPHKKPKIPVEYMGLLARFQVMEARPAKQITVLLSGPEPQRTLLEEKIVDQARRTMQPLTIVRGLPATEEQLVVPAFIQQFNHLETKDLQQLLQESELVITRSGYTSLMELMQLKIKTVLVPTPGQTEQEYLAKTVAEKGYALQIPQESFDLTTAILQSRSHTYRFPQLSLFDVQKMQALIASMPNHRNSKK